jgi:hypothetical protein
MTDFSRTAQGLALHETTQDEVSPGGYDEGKHVARYYKGWRVCDDNVRLLLRIVSMFNVSIRCEV